MRWLIVLALALPGCVISGSNECGNQACTDLFATVTVRIVDAANQPVDGLTTRSTYLELDSPVAVTSGLGGDGYYVVVDDNFLAQREVRLDYHTIRFEASGAPGTVTADYVIRAGECACHVELQQGPMLLRLP